MDHRAMTDPTPIGPEAPDESVLRRGYSHELAVYVRRGLAAMALLWGWEGAIGLAERVLERREELDGPGVASYDLAYRLDLDLKDLAVRCANYARMDDARSWATLGGMVNIRAYQRERARLTRGPAEGMYEGHEGAEKSGF